MQETLKACCGLDTSQASQIEKVVTLEESQYSLECIVIDFLDTEGLVEIVPQTRADLPSTLIGGTAIWVESEQPATSAYHLCHPYNDKSLLAIEYINNRWYYLNWDRGKYYTEPSSYIPIPISLGLGTFQAPAAHALKIP
jgi:hypothetical protein